MKDLNNNQKECPVCGSNFAQLSFVDPLNTLIFISCPCCGRFELKSIFDDIDYGSLNRNQLPPYLFYHRFSGYSSLTEYRYHSVINKEICDTYKANFETGDIRNGNPVHMNEDLINAWYPKTFSERVDYIIKYLGTHIEHIGQQISFTYAEMLSLLFVDRQEMSKSVIKPELVQRADEDCKQEAKYMLDSIVDSGIIEYSFGSEEEKAVFIRLTPKGYARVDELQKNTSYGKAVLVAMKFGDDTIPLRDAIRRGITNAGYVAVFIDEVQHNDFITPELLKHIRDSKFVVVDLTHQNNGAYFEEGYAMGLGKPVIQLCKQDTKLHFDIAQKNTIMWQSEDDIPDKLCNRIKATID